MASAERLSEEQRNPVRSQLGDLIAVFPNSELQNKNLELAESFPLYQISPAALEHHRTLEGSLEKSGMWHHQVTSDGKAIGVAHSEEQAGGFFRVANFFLSIRADKIASAIKAIDTRHRDDSVEARLVVSHGHELVFFVLNGATSSEVHIAIAPAAARELAEGEFYSMENFLPRIARAPRPRGLSDKAP